MIDGGSGWIQNGDVVPVEQTLSVDDVIALAPRFVGLPFTWGGVTTYGFDCSGFIEMLCRQRGVSLPRRLAHQVEWLGRHGLATDVPQAGDLALFGTDATKATHIGLMLTRERFIHSTVVGRPTVQLSHLADEPWRDRLRGFRRIQDESVRAQLRIDLEMTDREPFEPACRALVLLARASEDGAEQRHG